MEFSVCFLEISEATPMISHYLDKNHTNKHANMGPGKPTKGLNTQNYKQLRNSESGRNHLPQGRAHQLIIQYQMVSPETHTYL